MSVWKRSTIWQWISALLLFFMLREWLLPLQELTDTGVLWPFLVIVAGVLVIDVAIPHRWATLPLKVLGLLWLLHATLFDAPLFATDWLAELYRHIVHDLPLAFRQDWGPCPFCRATLCLTPCCLS